MANETDTGKRTKIATFTTHDDHSPPLMAHGAAVSTAPEGMVCLHFYADHYSIASEFTVFGDDNGETIEGGPPVAIRNVLATIVMTRRAAGRTASFLSGVLAEPEDQEEEE